MYQARFLNVLLGCSGEIM